MGLRIVLSMDDGPMKRRKHCGRSAVAHANGECVACGCIHLEVRDASASEARLRIRIGNVQFFVKNRWIN